LRLLCRGSRNKLIGSPELPNNTYLYRSYNRLIQLPELPNNVKLYCSYNQLTKIPELPNNIYLEFDRLTEIYLSS